MNNKKRKIQCLNPNAYTKFNINLLYSKIYCINLLFIKFKYLNKTFLISFSLMKSNFLNILCFKQDK